MSNPVEIRGVYYPSQAAAARALGVKPPVIYQALNTGTIDNVGLRAGRQPKIFILDRDKKYIAIKEFVAARPDINEKGFRRQVSLARKGKHSVVIYRKEIFFIKYAGMQQ